jgi:hypothetical protein
MPVELSGVNNLLKSLKAYAPELDKALRQELKDATAEVVAQAKAYAPAAAPLSNWGKGNGKFPLYDVRRVKSGIRLSLTKSKTNVNGFASTVRIVNASAAGAIYETAGRANPFGQPWVGPKGTKGKRYSHSPNKYAGRDFIQAMGGQMKGKGDLHGRLLYRAWDEDKGKTFDAVIRAVIRTNDLFQSKTGGLVTNGIKKVS